MKKNNFLQNITKLFNHLNCLVTTGLDTSYIKHQRKKGIKTQLNKSVISNIHQAEYITLEEYRGYRDKEISKLTQFINKI
mmetsp:Transcript_27506/g.24385  ORF Transcript_27506/g.24385 Transcript_27506/m.24385 type:complete len:80 (+) Transcript_27506:155-394(+)